MNLFIVPIIICCGPVLNYCLYFYLAVDGALATPYRLRAEIGMYVRNGRLICTWAYDF